MLHTVFYWLLSMSITASLMGAIILLLRCISKMPKRVAVFLWLVPFLRMSIPVGMDTPYNLMSLLVRFMTKQIVVFAPQNGPSFSVSNSVGAAESYFPLTYKAALLDSIFRVASVIWLIGVLLLAATYMITYIQTLQQTKKAIHSHQNIYYSKQIASPAVYGILKPKILLPLSFQNADNRFVILHEQAHLRRGDNLWRVLALLVTVFHWFNPLAWLFLKLFLEDLELACDEQVLCKLTDKEAKAYAHSLLHSQARAQLLVSAFGGASLPKRIRHILSFQRMTWISLIGSIVLLVAIFCVLLTNAA